MTRPGISKWWNISIQVKDGILTGSTTSIQSGTGNNSNEMIFQIPLSFRTEDLQSGCLVSYFTASAYWAGYIYYSTTACPGNEIKLYLIVRLPSWRFGNAKKSFIIITLWSTMTRSIISVRVSSTDQIELFNYLLLLFTHLSFSHQR